MQAEVMQAEVVFSCEGDEVARLRLPGGAAYTMSAEASGDRPLPDGSHRRIKHCVYARDLAPPPQPPAVRNVRFQIQITGILKPDGNPGMSSSEMVERGLLKVRIAAVLSACLLF